MFLLTGFRIKPGTGHKQIFLKIFTVFCDFVTDLVGKDWKTNTPTFPSTCTTHPHDSLSLSLVFPGRGWTSRGAKRGKTRSPTGVGWDVRVVWVCTWVVDGSTVLSIMLKRGTVSHRSLFKDLHSFTRTDWRNHRLWSPNWSLRHELRTNTLGNRWEVFGEERLKSLYDREDETLQGNDHCVNSTQFTEGGSRSRRTRIPTQFVNQDLSGSTIPKRSPTRNTETNEDYSDNRNRHYLLQSNV